MLDESDLPAEAHELMHRSVKLYRRNRWDFGGKTSRTKTLMVLGKLITEHVYWIRCDFLQLSRRENLLLSVLQNGSRSAQPVPTSLCSAGYRLQLDSTCSRICGVRAGTELQNY